MWSWRIAWLGSRAISCCWSMVYVCVWWTLHFTYLNSACPWMCSDSVAEPKWQSLSSLGSPCHTRHKISHPATAAWKALSSVTTPAALPQAGTLLSLRTLTVNNLSPPCPLWDSGDNGTGRSATACFWLSFNLWSLRGGQKKALKKTAFISPYSCFFLVFLEMKQLHFG